MLHVIIFTSFLSIWSAVVYQIYKLNNAGIVISLVLAVFSFVLLLYRYLDFSVYLRRYLRLSAYKHGEKQINADNNADGRRKKFRKSILLYFNKKCKKHTEVVPQARKITFFFYTLFIIYFLLFSLCIYILFQSQTIESIASPWQVVPDYFFAIYSMATFILIIIILKNPKSLILILISMHYFLSFSVAVIIYKIGYGFDPFIHQAGVDLINKTGAIFPKTFYYLGQYGLEVIIHKITSISLILIDKLLVPFLSALFLPASIFYFLQKWFKNQKVNLLLLIFLLTLPFSLFIITVPQNLAYLFLLITILFGLACSNTLELIIVYLCALTSFVAHPIAGIPALLFAVTLTIYHNNKLNIKTKKYLYLLAYILSSIALPLSFYFVHLKNNINFALIKNNILKLSLLFPKIIVPDQENFILNFIYLYGFNIKIILFILIAFGAFIVCRHKKTQEVKIMETKFPNNFKASPPSLKLFGNLVSIYKLCIYMACSLLMAYCLTKLMPFNFLIEYERNNYADRILIVIVLFCLPFIIFLFHWLIERIIKQKKAIQTIYFLFLTAVVASSLYLSYPRFDNYYNSHSWSTGQNDIAAVQWIENNAQKKYIVLANQQVSAAALKEFGFNRYLSVKNSQIYFYPIPTGGQLYQYYLDMVYKKPSRETALKAMDFAGVNEAYFVLNKYWWASSKILDEAKLESDAWHKIDNGEIYVFQYNQ
ncbi:hypothetical protein KKC56_00800 [Patescibacteria group bacterium]|nr:hypothetical protein [Patescibacteria group bacterium]